MDEIELRCEIIIRHMLPYQLSIRQCEISTGIPRSTIHYTIHHYISQYYPVEYRQLTRLLYVNKEVKFYKRKEEDV